MQERKIIRRSRPSHASIRTTVFNISRADDSTSRQIAFNDEFLSLASVAGATVLLPTPYAVGRLFEIIDQSNMLRQCIDAFVTNTVLAGWEAEPVQRGKDANEGEKVELESFLDHANTDQDLKTVMELVMRDREACGFGFLEVIRNIADEVSLLRHCPSLWTRLCAKDPTEILVSYTISRGRRVSVVQEYRRFRRFIQIMNGQQVWFKEFGDPRRMDYLNGAYEGQSGYNPSRQATEVIHFKNPSNDPYGVPRWINQLPSILGSREAEEVNMRYFQDNTVPPMLLLVGNGRLTSQSYKELTTALNSKDIGAQRQNKIMLLEAVGEGDSLDGKNSAIELKVEKLTDARQSDGLFRLYDEANMAKVRSSFRLPPITVGMSQDVNFATASTSAFVAESQVFAPERDKTDQVLNKLLVNGKNGLNLKSVKLVSRIPSITSPEMLIKTLTALNVIGAITPRSAQEISNKVLQTEIPPYPPKGSADYEEWMDRPIIFAQRGPRGSGYDEGAQDGSIPGGATVDEQGNPITPSGKTPSTHNAQALKDAGVKQVEGDGNVGSKQPKHGQE